MTFDMQWRYVIGIQRDLFFNVGVKLPVKPFSFFFIYYGENKLVIKVR